MLVAVLAVVSTFLVMALALITEEVDKDYEESI